MNGTIEILNSVGAAFVKNSFAMLIQSSLLILLVMGLDFIFRKKIRAIVRYCLWMLVLVKLVLPTTLAMPTGVGYWLGGGFLNPEIAQTQPSQDALPLDYEIVSSGAASTVSLSNSTSDAVAELPAERQPAAVAVAVNASHPEITWQAVAFMGWLAVVVAMGLLLLQRIMFVGGLLSQSVPAGDDLLTLLGDCKRTLGINSARKVDIKLSTNSASPAICGLFRPVILMPEFLPDKLGKSELRAVLLHELIHLKRGDLWVNTVQTLLQIINFFNPLLWFANAIIRRVREQAVDEAVMVSMGQGSEDYPQALLNVASLSLSRPALSLRLVGVVESKSALAGRIKHLLTRPLPKSAKLGIAGTIMLLTFAFLLLPMAGAAPKPAKEVVDLPTKELLLSHDNGKSEGMWSFAGSGHGVKFEAPAKGYKLTAVQIYGSRYGYPQPPKEDFHVWLCDSEFKVLKEFSFPYSTFVRGNPQWVTLPIMPTAVPEKFVIFVGFNPERTKGIYVHYSSAEGNDSLVGLPDGDTTDFTKGNWMIRCKLQYDTSKNNVKSYVSTDGQPQIMQTVPAAFANDVSPELGKITVTFDRAMQDGSWSWTGGGDTFPKGDGKISYDDAHTTCTMPVRLEPGKVYWMGINSPSHRNFKSVERVPARRYVILFATKGADGKPTTIPQDMLDRAKMINAASQPK